MSRNPDLRGLPLISGARIVSESRQCDRGASAYCAIELVIVAPGYKTPAAVVTAEHAELKRHGWNGANADTGDERAAEAPGQKLRVTYATAYGDLKGVDVGWIKRSRGTALALSRALFNQSSAISILLEAGPA